MSAPAVTVIVPLAVVPRPFSGNTNGRPGDEAGVPATVGDGGEPVPVDPQAAAIKTTAAIATNLLNLEFPDHFCPPALPMKVT